ncbi:MAG: hypothetical protein A2Y82_03645 [Candidatus Buchananbacteria bacterium RBG_13_36_9]|uniref:Uncharacterized protein n=1 Tax=Candidatus Buchananbacteria bacterium RBG_13_36_9 TaxID=1797530 RepID=A0A1G1XLL8_9BACT|nr:MAG: hypothetical protein A2Y82_03645 [Candidatus Buchananbacteria bacterium RBG_13_36_9]
MGDNDCYNEPTTIEMAAKIKDLERQVSKLKATIKAKNKIIASLKGEKNQKRARTLKRKEK